MIVTILGVKVDLLSRDESLRVIEDFLKESPGKRMKMVATAYSEFFVRAQKDERFKDVLNKADLVTPDGISVLAANWFNNEARGKCFFKKISLGWQVGSKILRSEIGRPVTGVFLFDSLTRKAVDRGWRVFLLGGLPGTAQRVSEKLKRDYPGMLVEFDEGERVVGSKASENERVIEKINRFKPDILCVAYGPVKQEKWIFEHRGKLKAKLAIGLGGTFNEYLGDVAAAPEWMEKMGLKWLWRVIKEPKRLGRIWRAVVVFPWLVYTSK